MEKLRNLENESSRLWSHITSRYCDFGQNQKDSEMILKISKLDLIKFFDKHFARSSETRVKASVHICSAKNYKDPAEDPNGEITFVEAQDLDDLHSQLELTDYPIPSQ